MTFLYTAVFLLFYSCFGDKNKDLLPHDSPSNVTLIDINGKHLQIQWDPIDPKLVRGSFRGYVVRIWNNAGSQVYAIPPDVTRASLEYFPYSKNFITVSVRNNKFVGPPSDPIYFDAPQGQPNYPFLFEAHQLSATSALLQWNEPTQPNGVLLGYKIYYTEMNDTYLNDETAFSYYITDPKKLQAKVTGLREHTKYKIGIASVNCVGESLVNYLDFEMYAHYSFVPSPPDFKYKIGYLEFDADDQCIETTSNDDSQEYEDDDEFILGTNKPNNNDPRSSDLKLIKEEHPCIVDTLITWLPNVVKHPGDHFYVKYRVKGTTDFIFTAPEFEKDYIVLSYFNACKNYEIIVTSVDGEFNTDSETVTTPALPTRKYGV